MTAGNFCFGIPDVDLQRLDGRTINPSHFAGHELVVIFCPAGRPAAAAELSEYAEHAGELYQDDAWIIAVTETTAPVGDGRKVGVPFTVACDPDHRAWSEFENLLKPEERTFPDEGGVFIFSRGGVLQRAWSGSGHAAEVFQELQSRL